jgi:hypothetical protein
MPPLLALLVNFADRFKLQEKKAGTVVVPAGDKAGAAGARVGQ